MKSNLSTLAILFFLIMGIESAMANTQEVCTNNQVTVVLQRSKSSNLQQIDLYLSGKLFATDNGPFWGGPCHVDGQQYTEKIFSYGGCYPSDEKEAKFLKLVDTNQIYDLNEFRCYVEPRSVPTQNTRCCNPCKELATPGSCH